MHINHLKSRSHACWVTDVKRARLHTKLCNPKTCVLELCGDEKWLPLCGPSTLLLVGVFDKFLGIMEMTGVTIILGLGLTLAG